MGDGVPDLGQQQVTHGAAKLWADFLGLVADVQLRNLRIFVVGLEQASQHPNERRLAGAVLAEQNNNLRVREVALLQMAAKDRIKTNEEREIERR